MELIRIDVLLLFPDVLIQKEPPEPGGLLPKSFELISRVPKRHTMITNGMEIALGPAQELDHVKLQLPPNHHVALLALRLTGCEFHSALLNSQPTIESIIDHLSFQMQVAIQPLSIDILDVTPIVKVGDEREAYVVTNPGAVLMPKFYLNPWDMSMQTIPIRTPLLTNRYQVSDVRNRVALWWYVKAMAVPYIVDQLMFLFTAVEKLSEPHLTGPYKTSCNHEIANCPTCNASISQPLRGDSIKKYLIEKGGLSEQEANDLWKIRQVVHGKDVFTFEELSRISVLTGRLRSVVLKGLKSALEFSVDGPPLLFPTGGPVIGPSIDLGGSRKIDKFDLELEKDLDLAKNGGAKEQLT